MNKKTLFLCVLLFLCNMHIMKAEVKLPHIFSDNMVIQRDKAIKIWGWADKKENVELSFNGQKLKTKADANGKWNIMLKSMAYGGPYDLTVKGKKNTIVLGNILIGDVWLASGQSNMEFKVKNANNATSEIAESNYPQIRSFNVVKTIQMTPQSDLDGQWTVCSPSTVGDYSAVAYFFARKLYQETKIPIGIIHSSWGGTDIETWTSPEAFAALPTLFNERYADNVKVDNPEAFMKENEKKKNDFLRTLKNDPALKQEWFKPSTNITDWSSFKSPGLWSGNLAQIDGILWQRIDVVLPDDVAGKSGRIELGAIDDNDITWINGIKVGETVGYNVSRSYDVPANVLKAGKNTIVVRVEDTGGGGGLTSTDENVFISVDGKKYSLSGNWRYKISVSNELSGYVNFSPNYSPSLLYNGMINPIIPYIIKGAIWYQGENNALAAYNYRTLFPNLVKDWRTKWGYEFPFYWVQLANFMKMDKEPVESNWAELREAQTMTLVLPKTGQAVTIDIGDADDIHPRNKQDVGLRLALNALHNDYGAANLVYSSPTYKSVEFRDGRAVVSFNNIGSGLKVHNNYGYVQGFSIAGADKKFVWAKAYIDGDKVVVSSDRVPSPVAVRYDWANNPDGNLFNEEGLPVCPFRSDSWKGITER